MLQQGLIPWLDTENIVTTFGPWALLVIGIIVFSETGLLVGFLLPGDTLLFAAGLLTATGSIGLPIWLVCLIIFIAAHIGGDLGYLIGRIVGPKIFEKRESGFFSKKNVQRTNKFFEKYGALAVIVARFVPIVRTFMPVAAGVSKLSYARYTLYNASGAALWGGGLTFLGFLLAGIPWIRETALQYMDVVILGVVIIAIIPTAFHYAKAVIRSRKLKATEKNARKKKKDRIES